MEQHQLSKERVTKLARVVQRLFAQYIELRQPPYSWIHSRVLKSGIGDRQQVISVSFPKLLEEWRSAQ